MNILRAKVARDGCSFYRVTQPYETINTLNLADVIELTHEYNGDALIELITGADVIVMRPGHEPLYDTIMKFPDAERKLFVYDLDDDLWDISPFTEIYRYGGTGEVKYEGKWLWKNGENGFDAHRNKATLEMRKSFLQKMDLITVTTERLKKRIVEHSGNPNVEVLPNAVDLNHWNKLPLKKHEGIRVGWAGGSTHYVDWFTIKDKLPEALGDSRLVLMGCKWDGTLKGIDYEFHDWIDAEGYPYKMATLDIDIALIPLKDMSFNYHKSCIKWYEFSALEIPAVVANVPPYADEIEHSITGLLYNTPEEMVEYVNLLKNNPKLRAKIGENARKWVEKNRNITNVAQNYAKIIKTYLKQKRA